MNRLKKERLLLGLKQRELAKQVGCSELDISKFETERKTPNYELKKRFAELFKIPTYEIFNQ